MADAILKKVSKQARSLQVKLDNAQSRRRGSGWFVDPGMVITNAHVLNHARGRKRFPSRSKSRSTAAKKKKNDAAPSPRKFKAPHTKPIWVLEVDGDPASHPEPAPPPSPDAELKRRRPLYSLRLPPGENSSLAKGIHVRAKSSISSLRKEKRMATNERDQTGRRDSQGTPAVPVS